MKVKAREGKLNYFNVMNVPCESKEFSALRDNKEVDLKEDIANKMLAMGIVEKVKNKKANKKGDK